MSKKKYVMVLILLMVIGFAAVATNLYINGTINFTGNQESFAEDVIFTRAETDGDGVATIYNGGKSIRYTSRILTDLEEETVLDFDITNYSRYYDAEATIFCSFKNESDLVGKENDMILSEYLSVKSDKKTYNIDARRTESGYLTSKLIKSYIDTDIQSIDIECTLNVAAKERTTLADDDTNSPLPARPEKVVVEKVDGVDGNTVGDEVKIGDEYFYVIDSDDDKLTLFSWFNLEVTDGAIQPRQKDVDTSREYGAALASGNFSDGGYWTCPNNQADSYCRDELGKFVNINKPYSERAIAVNAADAYAKNLNINLTGRLLTHDDLIKLVDFPIDAGGIMTAKSGKEKLLDIVKGTDAKQGWLAYWMGSASGGRTVWYVEAGTGGAYNDGNFTSTTFFGIRPVVEVPKDLIKKS